MMTSGIDVGEGAARRRIAILHRAGAGPPVVWFGGFRSEMRGAKADALDTWAEAAGRAFVRFDYSGHGASDGAFVDGTITRWLEDALAVLAVFAAERPILVGSSMGGWLALLATRTLRGRNPERAPAALVLIAPAVDFTETLMWEAFDENARQAIETQGMYTRPSTYSGTPPSTTRPLIGGGPRPLPLAR